jgi:hypothetical protein
MEPRPPPCYTGMNIGHDAAVQFAELVQIRAAPLARLPCC